MNTDPLNETPIRRKRHRSSRLPMNPKQIQREITLKIAARDRQDQEIEQLKLVLIQNAREQKAQRGLETIIKTLERLQPADVSTFLMMLCPFIIKEEELNDVYSWQEMHAEVASSDRPGSENMSPAD